MGWPCWKRSPRGVPQSCPPLRDPPRSSISRAACCIRRAMLPRLPVAWCACCPTPRMLARWGPAAASGPASASTRRRPTRTTPMQSRLWLGRPLSAVQRPAQRAKSENPSRNGPIYWLPWLAHDELLVAMRNAACTVLPSITEGFGLAAAESISQGVATLYQQVGGHHGLQALPNALPVPLTTSERAHLYGLWSELIGIHPDSWPVWTRHEISLSPLVDKWVEAIRSVVYRVNGGMGSVKNAHFPERPVEERWANKLRRRIEVGPNV